MKTVLVVEDSPDYSEVVKFTLSHKGYNVVLAETGEEALQKARSSKPDLILMDVMLPDQDGADTVKQIKEQGSLFTVPIIFLTALTSDGDSGDKVLVVNGESFPVISKMVDQEEIARVVEKYLKSRA